MKRLCLFLFILSLVAILGCGDGGGDADNNAANNITPGTGNNNGGQGTNLGEVTVLSGTGTITPGSTFSIAFTIPQTGHILGGFYHQASGVPFIGQVTLYFIIDGKETGVIQSSGSNWYLFENINITKTGTAYMVIVNGQSIQLPIEYNVQSHPENIN